MAMGAADIVPGVSGGTIAFITGIYEQLLSSINAINFKLLNTFKEKGIKGVWEKINGRFLFTLLMGIGISIFSLAKLFKYLLSEYPVLVWAFFFGLVFGSIFLVGRQIKTVNYKNVFAFFCASVLAYFITTLTPVKASEGYLIIFFSGMIAIIAMILPGISGSFILVLLGTYELVLRAISSFDISVIAVFALGAILGLLSFSRLLKWTLDHYFDLSISILTGFLMGSLNKIWPWKKTISTALNRHGEMVPIVQKNVWPHNYMEGEPQLIWAIMLAFLGVLIIFGLFKWGQASERRAKSITYS